ncbi:hypothetical protein [Actinomadura rupiterrae]|uniref:hypothetical protein n=1 Tax=Actinomadura rupiterrae TaxID=559627 RepID=UPI0020A26C73|nr:hypothetical protein [Actinomadura rupiterrae]MCP2335224.1 hypothetical protein [Actinomadura rupiterrae]
MAATRGLARGLDEAGRGGPVPRPRARRNGPLVLLGLLLVVGCGLAFAVAAAGMGARRPVLIVVRSLPAGAVVQATDLATVQVEASAAVRLVPAGQRSAVVGRALAVPVLARSLLTPEAVGAVRFPPVGQAVLAVAVKPGRFPPDLVPGARVRVFAVAGSDQQPASKPAGGAEGGAALPVTAATVLRVDPVREGEGSVVELQLPADDVPQVAPVAAAGAVSLVLVAGS